MPRRRSHSSKSSSGPLRLAIIVAVVAILGYLGVSFATGSGPASYLANIPGIFGVDSGFDVLPRTAGGYKPTRGIIKVKDDKQAKKVYGTPEQEIEYTKDVGANLGDTRVKNDKGDIVNDANIPVETAEEGEKRRLQELKEKCTSGGGTMQGENCINPTSFSSNDEPAYDPIDCNSKCATLGSPVCKGNYVFTGRGLDNEGNKFTGTGNAPKRECTKCGAGGLYDGSSADCGALIANHAPVIMAPDVDPASLGFPTSYQVEGKTVEVKIMPCFKKGDGGWVQVAYGETQGSNKCGFGGAWVSENDFNNQMKTLCETDGKIADGNSCKDAPHPAPPCQESDNNQTNSHQYCDNGEPKIISCGAQNDYDPLTHKCNPPDSPKPTEQYYDSISSCQTAIKSSPDQECKLIPGGGGYYKYTKPVTDTRLTKSYTTDNCDNLAKSGEKCVPIQGGGYGIVPQSAPDVILYEDYSFGEGEGNVVQPTTTNPQGDWSVVSPVGIGAATSIICAGTAVIAGGLTAGVGWLAIPGCLAIGTGTGLATNTYQTQRVADIAASSNLTKGSIPENGKCFTSDDCQDGYCTPSWGNVVSYKCSSNFTEVATTSTFDQVGKYRQGISCYDDDQCGTGLHCAKPWYWANTCQPDDKNTYKPVPPMSVDQPATPPKPEEESKPFDIQNISGQDFESVKVTNKSDCPNENATNAWKGGYLCYDPNASTFEVINAKTGRRIDGEKCEQAHQCDALYCNSDGKCATDPGRPSN